MKRTDRIEELGRGSYGRVIEVSVSGTICAAKVIHEFFRVEEVGKEEFEYIENAFLNECANSSGMLHPNVVQFMGIHYPSPKAKLPWLIMEMLHTSLHRLIKKHASASTDIPFHIKLSILLDTSQGLQFLHSKGVIHRDLSSNNVLITKHMDAKIADFGMAKMISLKDDSKESMQKTRAPGTLPFMSPEALLVKPKYGKPLDVFSLGCVSTHVISMEYPMPADLIKVDEASGEKVIQSEVERREDYLKKMNDESPLKQLMIRCLKDNPNERPTVEVVTQELKSIMAVVFEKCKHANSNILDVLKTLSQQEELVGEYRQQIFEKGQQIAELKASHEKTLLLKENEIEKLREALQGECRKTSNIKQALEHQKSQSDHSSSTCTKLTKHRDMLRTTLETERKQSDIYLQEIEKLNIQNKEVKMLLQEAREDLTKQKIIYKQEKIAADNTLNKSKLAISNLKGQLEAKHKQDINNLHKKYAGQLAMERDKICGERNAYKRKLAELCTQQQTSAQIVIASSAPAAAASTAMNVNSSPSVRVTKQGKHKTKRRKKKMLPSRARNMVYLSSKTKEHSPSKNSRKKTAPITFTDSPMEKLYSPVLLWQCAVCEKVNDTVYSNCKACKKVRGNSAVTESFCTPCKLVVYAPIDKQHMTVCPNCNLLTLKHNQY